MGEPDQVVEGQAEFVVVEEVRDPRQGDTRDALEAREALEVSHCGGELGRRALSARHEGLASIIGHADGVADEAGRVGQVAS
ncbi:hypothetical protein AB0H12_14570 [Actinosynnema sp. NPDC023794]